MRRALPVTLLVAAFAAPGACSDPTVEPCRNIPTGGCRGDDGTNCEDPTCSEIYTCEADGTWTPVFHCPARAGGMDAGKPSDSGTGDADAHPLLDARARDLGIDVPPGASGGPGCTELESPDCPLALALACSMSCCGCQDLWVCSDGGWGQWGECSDAGVPVETR